MATSGTDNVNDLYLVTLGKQKGYASNTVRHDYCDRITSEVFLQLQTYWHAICAAQKPFFITVNLAESTEMAGKKR